jgi:hypothetical protein
MAAGKSIEDILSGAKAAVSHAEDKFPTSQAPAAAAPIAKHEYSDAPYSLVKPKAATGSSVKAKPGAGILEEAKSAGEGIKARMEMERKAQQ